MPRHGFTRMFANMLDHPNIKIMLNTDYREIDENIPYREMVYTGPIDEFFDFRYDKLPYRSLRFGFETYDTPVYQAAAWGRTSLARSRRDHLPGALRLEEPPCQPLQGLLGAQ